MAPRRPPARRGSQSPNTVLVIFLILFVLATIVAGVLAYYGYDGQKKLREVAAGKETEAKAARKAEEYALFQAFIARKAIGAPLLKNEPDEQTQWEADLEGMEIDPKAVVLKGKFEGEKSKGAVEEMFKKAVDDLGWDAKGKKFNSTYRDVFARLGAQVRKAQGENATALAQKDALKDEIEKVAAARKAFYEKEQAEIKAAGEKALEAAMQKTKEIGDLLKQNTDLNDKIKTTKEKYEQDLRAKDKRIFELNTLLTAAKKEAQLAEAGGQPAEGGGPPAARPAAQVHALLLDVSQGKPLWDRPVAKVTRVDARTKKVYLDKGRAAGIRPQMTFSVFGAGPGGRAEGHMKGTVEVQDVLDDNTSVAAVTTVYDDSGNEVPLSDYRRNTFLRQTENPIREGDLLFNLAIGAHVAVVGAPGWSGLSSPSAREQMQEVRQLIGLLRKEGATVDAYLDLTDGQIKGRITPRTNYVLRGDLPAQGGDAADPAVKAAKGVADAARKMTDEAVANGAFLISADNFLTVMGYRRPRGAEDQPAVGFRPGVLTAGTGQIGQALQGGGEQQNPPNQEKQEKQEKK